MPRVVAVSTASSATEAANTHQTRPVAVKTAVISGAAHSPVLVARVRVALYRPRASAGASAFTIDGNAPARKTSPMPISAAAAGSANHTTRPAAWAAAMQTSQAADQNTAVTSNRRCGDK